MGIIFLLYLSEQNLMNNFLWELNFSNPNEAFRSTNNITQTLRGKGGAKFVDVQWPAYDAIKQDYLLFGKKHSTVCLMNCTFVYVQKSCIQLLLIVSSEIN